MKKALIAAILLAVSVPGIADMFTPSNSCYKPSKPYQFNSQWEVDNYNNEVDRYKRCIQDFIDEQNDAAQKHLDAAEEAADEWNRFVRYGY